MDGLEEYPTEDMCRVNSSFLLLKWWKSMEHNQSTGRSHLYGIESPSTFPLISVNCHERKLLRRWRWRPLQFGKLDLKKNDIDEDL
jgi:hypothetical protein